MKSIFWLAICLLLGTSSLTWAHKISIFAYIEGQTLQGQVYFNDGSPAKKAKVTVLPTHGKKILAETRTDEEGNFKIPLPKGLKGTIRIVALAEMGHRAEMKLALKEPEDAGPSPAPGFPEDFGAAPQENTSGPQLSETINKKELQALIDQELEKQIAPLRQILEEIVKQLQKPSFSEIFGGIGYIFGFFGIMAWAYSRKE